MSNTLNDIKQLRDVEYIDKSILNFNDWECCYGVCIDCAVDIIRVDRDSWLDDKCHRHKFMGLEID